MNKELIYKLREQTKIDPDELADLCHNGTNAATVAMFLERFAEEIVRECAVVSSNWVMDTDGSDLGVARAVKAHFGVE